MAKTLKDPGVHRDLALPRSEEPLFIATMCSEPSMQPPTFERDLGPGYEPNRVKSRFSMIVELELFQRSGRRNLWTPIAWALSVQPWWRPPTRQPTLYLEEPLAA